MENKNKKHYFAVKMVTAFGTYTMATYETRQEALDDIRTKRSQTTSVYFQIQEVDGIYNGNLKIA